MFERNDSPHDQDRRIPVKTLARVGGALYLALAVAGGFSQLYVRESVTVAGDAAATAFKVAEHATLMRAGFGLDLLNITLFLLVALVMYAIFERVDRRVALGMVAFNAVGVAVMSLNMLNHLGALLLATEPRYTAGLSPETSHALVSLLLDLHGHGYLIAQIFFGLWLFPLGYLVYVSGYFPKTLGVLLMIGTAGYLTDVVVTVLSSRFESSLSLYLTMPSGLAEMAFLLWLLIRGARVPGSLQPVPAAA